MALTDKLAELIEVILGELILEPDQQKQFRELANAWERALGTMVTIEPDDDFKMNDAPQLPELESREQVYDELQQQADARVKYALRKYVARRRAYLD